MIKLTIRCPHCKNTQKYVSYKSNKKWEIYGKNVLCRRCGVGIIIKGARTDNIIKEGW